MKSTEWNSVAFERYRWLIAQYIIALERAK